MVERETDFLGRAEKELDRSIDCERTASHI